MVRQYDKILLLASMVFITTACSTDPTLQSEGFRWNNSHQLRDGSWSAMRGAERHEQRLV